MEKKYLLLEDISEAYSLKVRHLRTLCQQGKVKASKIGKRWYVSPADIERLFRMGVQHGR